MPDKRMPTTEERDAMWHALDFPVHEAPFPHIANYLTSLNFERVLHKAFRLPNHPVFDFYLSLNQFRESGLFEHFWSTPSVASNLPYTISEPQPGTIGVFRWESPFLLSGSLAAVWAAGGMYGSGWCSGNASEAKRIAGAAADELLQSDYSHTHLFSSHRAWCDFFCDVGIDHTWILLHLSQRLIHVVLATDTD